MDTEDKKKVKRLRRVMILLILLVNVSNVSLCTMFTTFAYYKTWPTHNLWVLVLDHFLDPFFSMFNVSKEVFEEDEEKLKIFVIRIPDEEQKKMFFGMDLRIENE